MFTSFQFSDSSYGIKNAIASRALINDKGVCWAVEGWNVYAKRRVCVNIGELEFYNGKEDTMVLVSNLIRKGMVSAS